MGQRNVVIRMHVMFPNMDPKELLQMWYNAPMTWQYHMAYKGMLSDLALSETETGCGENDCCLKASLMLILVLASFMHLKALHNSHRLIMDSTVNLYRIRLARCLWALPHCCTTFWPLAFHSLDSWLFVYWWYGLLPLVHERLPRQT